MSTCSHESLCTKTVFAKGLCKSHYWKAWYAARAADPASPRCHCGKPVLAKDLCGQHYQQQYREARPAPPACKEPECDEPVKARDWCEKHYRAFRRYGDPNGQAVTVKGQLCSLGDGRPARSRWIEDGEQRGVLCNPCYERLRKYGNPAEPPRRVANGEARYISDQGYVKISVPGLNGRLRTRSEHVVLMEELLGRPLAGDENVHHCNGVKHDNTINGPLVNYRSGNLELWSTKQPKGQRVPDKIAFALEILREYAPERLVMADQASTI
jgi:hypothetical protein